MESRQTGAGRLGRVESLAPAAERSTTSGGCQLLAAEMQALRSDWKQWEESVLRSQSSLREVLSQMALSEQAFAAQVAQLEEAVQRFAGQLSAWAQSLAPADSRHTDAEVVESWRKEKVSSPLLSQRLVGCKCAVTVCRKLLPSGADKDKGTNILGEKKHFYENLNFPNSFCNCNCSSQSLQTLLSLMSAVRGLAHAARSSDAKQGLP